MLASRGRIESVNGSEPMLARRTAQSRMLTSEIKEAHGYELILFLPAYGSELMLPSSAG